MKKKAISRYFIKTAFCLCVFSVLCLSGCMNGPGETSDEIQRRRVRVLKTNTSQIQDDVDAVIMLDKPSKLSDKPTR